MCEFITSDNSSGTFRNIMDSFDFHKKLLQLNDSASLNVTTLKFVESFLDNIPRELFIAYPGIEHLDVSDTNLERLENYDFTYNNKIISLNASHNELSKLSYRVMSSMSNLESLDVSYNIIDKVSSEAFIYNPKFKFLNLSHNRIGNLDFEFFVPLRDLTVLRLDNNLISHISRSYNFVTVRWKELYLQHNKLTSVPPSMLLSPEILDLSNNNLEVATFSSENLVELTIRDNELKNLAVDKGLRKLDASGNKKNSMSLQMNACVDLAYLDLSNCDLASPQLSLVDNLKSFKSLEYLDLSDVPVDLDAKAFKGLDKLQVLNLRGALSKKLPKDIFVDLKKLSLLDLSFCQLQEFDFVQVENSVELETIRLRESRLYTLSNWNNLTGKLKKLKELDIYGNKFSCDDFPNMVNEFEAKNIVLTQSEDIGRSTFERDSCIDERARAAEFPSGDGLGFLWYFLGFLLLCAVVAGIWFANRRFDLCGRLAGLTSSSSNRPRTAELLEEE